MSAPLRGPRRALACALAACAIGLALAAAPERARAQDDETPPPSLVVRSRPSGADVRLKGDREVLGRTPFTLERPLSGRYRLIGSAPGWERWQRTVQITPGANDTVWMTLRRKHVPMGVARSMVLPGWGSFYNEHPGHGWVLLAGDMVIAGTALVAEKQFLDKSDVYDQLQADADAHPTDPSRRLKADTARRDRDAVLDFRHNTVKVGAGWWALGIIDALLSPPPAPREGMSLRIDRGVGVQVAWRF